MSKGYALAVILTAISAFGSLFYLQNKVLTERHAATFAYAEGVNERVIAQKREQLDELVMKINKQLEEDSKERFRPILLFVAKAREEEDELLAAALVLKQGDSEDLNELLHQRQYILNNLRDSAASLLMEYGHQMDVNADDVDAKIVNHQRIIEEAIVPPIKDFSNPAYSLDRDLILLDYLNVLEKMLLDVTQISGGKVISCFFGPEFFPVISSQFSNPQLGETINTKLSVGNYATSLRSEDVFILVKGDTLRMGLDGTVDYNFKATKRGRQKFKMELFLRNPLTGEVRQEATSDYSYYVR
jgi:hypothetical protein